MEAKKVSKVEQVTFTKKSLKHIDKMYSLVLDALDYGAKNAIDAIVMIGLLEQAKQSIMQLIAMNEQRLMAMGGNTVEVDKTPPSYLG